jgi:hypothetical protein
MNVKYDIYNPSISRKFRPKLIHEIDSSLIPVKQTLKRGHKRVDDIAGLDASGLSDYGLKRALSEAVSSPNTLLTTDKSFATLVVGFPELEFSPNEVYSWPKAHHRPKPPTSASFGGPKFLDGSRNIVFLRDSCQIVRPVSPRDLVSVSRISISAEKYSD